MRTAGIFSARDGHCFRQYDVVLQCVGRLTFAEVKRVVFLLFSLIGVGVSFAKAQSMPAEVKRVMGKYACTTCHAYEARLIGPSWVEISKREYTAKQLAVLVRQPKPEHWPDYPPMQPIPHFTSEDAKIIADWLKQLKNGNTHAKTGSLHR